MSLPLENPRCFHTKIQSIYQKYSTKELEKYCRTFFLAVMCRYIIWQINWCIELKLNIARPHNAKKKSVLHANCILNLTCKWQTSWQVTSFQFEMAWMHTNVRRRKRSFYAWQNGKCYFIGWCGGLHFS